MTVHTFVPTGCKDQEQCWRQEFEHWCDEFQNYKKEFNEWQAQKVSSTLRTAVKKKLKCVLQKLKKWQGCEGITLTRDAMKSFVVS